MTETVPGDVIPTEIIEIPSWFPDERPAATASARQGSPAGPTRNLPYSGPDIRVPLERVVRDNGTRVQRVWITVPATDADADQFATEAYILQGWEWVEAVSRGLERVHRAVTDPDGLRREFESPRVVGYAAPYPGVAVPQAAPSLPHSAAVALVAAYRQEPPLTPAQLPAVASLAHRYQAAVDRLRDRIRQELRTVEIRAQQLLAQRLADSERTVADEALRYLERFVDGREAARAALVSGVAWEVGMTRRDVRALRGHVEDLVEPAQRVLRAREVVDKLKENLAVGTRSLKFAGPDAPVRLANTSAALEQAQARLQDEQGCLSNWIAAKALLFPILYRFSAKDIVTAAGDWRRRSVGALIHPKLRRTVLAIKAVRGRYLARSDPSQSLPDTEPHPDHYLGAELAGGSVWACPAIIQEALRYPREDPAPDAVVQDDLLSLPCAAARAVQAAYGDTVAEAEAWAAVLSVGLGFVAAGLDAVCPPLGFAVNLAMSGYDVWAAASEYTRSMDEFVYTLDPRLSLAAEPDVYAVATAIAFAALAVATPPHAKAR